MTGPDLPDQDDDTCQRCGGEGVVFECFDGFCEDADEGCDDCTRPCPECQRHLYRRRADPGITGEGA